MPLFGSWFGDDFDATLSRTRILSGKWVLVDANLENRFARWKPAAWKTVDIDLRTVLPAAYAARGRTGKRLKKLQEVIFIIGQQIHDHLLIENDRVQVLIRLDRDTGAFGVNLGFRLERSDGQGDFQRR